MAAPAVLTAHFFGTFRVSIDGAPVDIGASRRTRNLLAYLLAHRRAAVPRDVLMDVFWPAAAPDAARNSLHVALTGVRQALRAASPRSVVERRFDTYRIDDAVIDPCNEPVHRRLMACYAAAGLRHLALAQYQRLGVALWDAFQVRPSAETVELYDRLCQPCRPVVRRSA
jgi:DNA-binding SARP family transcriptional activator